MAKNIITESMLLPSGNKLYGGFSGAFTLRAMTTIEERMRVSAQSFYDIMPKIVNNCIVENEGKKPTDDGYIDSALFTEFDFFATCVKLRILSYGNMYKTVARCPVCGKVHNTKVDLTQLTYNFLPEDFSEPYDVGPLPRSGDTLGCRFIRIKDRVDIENKKNEILMKNQNYNINVDGDPAFTLEMYRRIMTVNGKNIDPIEAERYVDSMIAMDNVYYREHVDSDVYGVMRVGTVNCDSADCMGQAIYVLRCDREFFRPCLDD